MTPSKQWWGVNSVAAVAVMFLAIPVVSLMLRVPWSQFPQLITKPEALQAVWLSLLTSSMSTLLCAVLGTAVGLWLARRSGFGAIFVRVLVIVPLVLPPLVGGVAMLAAFGRRGVLEPVLSALDLHLPFSTVAVVMAQVFVALPFMVITVEASQRSMGVDYARMALGLGASRWMVLTRITLPLARTAITAGVLLCFARALGEYGATALFAGNAPGVTRTLPQAIAGAFLGTLADESVGYSMSGILVLVAVIVVFASGLWRQPQTVAVTQHVRRLEDQS